MKRLNLTGKRFENWMVSECVGTGKRGETLWLCICDCGQKRTIAGQDLSRGRKVRCENCYNPFYKDITEMRFGHLTVKEYAGKNAYGRSLWRCECDCGGSLKTITSSLLNGASASCGKCTSNELFAQMEGQSFGRWVVLAQSIRQGRGHLKFLCRCGCGKEKLVKVVGLLEGTSQSCGCLRSELQSGENSMWWKGGISSLQTQIRDLVQNSHWRMNVYRRDSFTCCSCHSVGQALNAHHIKPFAQILTEYNIQSVEEATHCAELWNIDNGVTLCVDCHKLAHKAIE